MPANQFLLYGANGYTGRLIARLAAEYDLNPVLGGRNEKAIQQLSKELRLPYRIINLDDGAGMRAQLKDFTLVLHAAGPFQATARPMIEACIDTHTHYLDITGEIAVFEMAKTFNEAAISAKIMVMPGVGFDVVPTDCMALFLKNKMPDARLLQLAFVSEGGGLSHGTATTMISNLGEGGAVRKNGLIIKKPLGHLGKWINFTPVTGLEKRKFVMTIPWGDISTANFTTGIPDIETYTGISPTIFRMLKLQGAFNGLLKSSTVRRYLLKLVNKRSPGPSDEQRKSQHSLVWGKVVNNSGHSIEAFMLLKDGYTLTAHSSLLIIKKVMNGIFKAGYQTPAAVFGEDLILEVPETKRTQAFYNLGSS